MKSILKRFWSWLSEEHETGSRIVAFDVLRFVAFVFVVVHHTFAYLVPKFGLRALCCQGVKYEMKPTRDASLDMLKGLCMGLIILVHIAGRSLPHAFCTWANSFKLVGFFVVSGYLLTLRDQLVGPEGLTGALRQRGSSLMLPYLFFSILVLLINPALRTSTLVAATGYLNIVAANTVTLRGQSTLWFLPVLFIAESLLLLVLAGERRLRSVPFHGLVVLVAILAVVASVVLSPLAAPYIRLPPNQQIVGRWVLPWLRALPAYVVLALGFLIYGPLNTHCRNRFVRLAVGAFLLVAGWVLARQLPGGVDWNNNVYGGNLVVFLASGVSTSFGFLLLFGAIPPRLGVSMLGFLGVNSLVLMATHLPFPMIDLARNIVSFSLRLMGVETGYAAEHALTFGIIVFVVVLLLELPVIMLFNHTPLRFFIGRRAFKSRQV